MTDTIVNQKIKVQMATFRYESDLKGHDRRRFEDVTEKAQRKNRIRKLHNETYQEKTEVNSIGEYMLLRLH